MFCIWGLRSTFLSFSSLGISAILVRPTFMRLSVSRLENSSVMPSIFPSLETQLSSISSLIWKMVHVRSGGCKGWIILFSSLMTQTESTSPAKVNRDKLCDSRGKLPLLRPRMHLEVTSQRLYQDIPGNHSKVKFTACCSAHASKDTLLSVF